MAQISLTDYSAQQADLQRQLRMADLLQQQASAPIEIQSYKGIQAPIPWTATLAKVLESYAAAKKNKDIGKEGADIADAALKQRVAALQAYSAPTQSDINTAGPTMGPAVHPGMIDALRGMLPGQQGAPPPSMAAPPQGMPPGPPQLPMSAAPIPAAGPPAASPAQDPAVISAPAPGTVLGEPAPVPVAAPPSTDHATTGAERQQMALQMLASTDPTLQTMGSKFYAETVQQGKTERMAKAIAGADLNGADPMIVKLHLDADDPDGAVDYLGKFSASKQEAAAKIAEIQLKAKESAEQRELDRQARKDIADQASRDRRDLAAQASADRRAIAAQSSADRMAAAAMAQANRPGRPMPAAIQTDLVNKATLADSADRTLKEFKPRYVGHVIMGDTGLALNRLTGADKEAAQWWGDYKNYQAEVLHDRYGGALTANEFARYKQYSVDPRMDAKVAAGNLKIQNDIIQTALARKARAQVSLGYAPDVVTELTGRDPATMSVAAPAYGGGAQSPAGASETKVLGGVTYHKVNGQWVQ